MSIPISSTSTGMPPSEVTQSAMVSAPTSWAASQIGCPWLYNPVEVSACTKATTRGCSRRMKSRASCGSKGSPHGLDRRTTSAPWRRAISPMRSPKKPLVRSANFSPGSMKLATAVSMPAVPVQHRHLRHRHRRFHARGAGAGDGDVELVLGGKSVAEQGADLVDHLEEERVEMADHRLPHGLVDAGRDHAGSGSEEKALRRLERSIGLRHHVQFNSRTAAQIAWSPVQRMRRPCFRDKFAICTTSAA